jgi:hypothetical protein
MLSGDKDGGKFTFMAKYHEALVKEHQKTILVHEIVARL